jgi:hypothetical protein
MSFHTETCPYCANPQCDAEWCDVGVGFQQVAPFHCEQCHAVQIGPYDKLTPTPAEAAAGWYSPGRLPDTFSSVNGYVIDTKTSLRLYQAGVTPHAPFHITMEEEDQMRLLGFSLTAPSSQLQA